MIDDHGNEFNSCIDTRCIYQYSSYYAVQYLYPRELKILFCSELLEFNAIFNSISVIPRRPVTLACVSWLSLSCNQRTILPRRSVTFSHRLFNRLLVEYGWQKSEWFCSDQQFTPFPHTTHFQQISLKTLGTTHEKYHFLTV